MKKLKPETNLETAVARWVKTYHGDPSKQETKAILESLFVSGCVSGTVAELVRFEDTLPFYRKHRPEINTMIAEYDMGCDSLFGDQWDGKDPLALGEHNQNLLAWFGFEEAARRLYDRAMVD